MDISKYQMLDEIPMMLLRPDTFVGSIEAKTISSYIFADNGAKPVWRDITYNPALLKLFDEVLQNCYDHSKRPEGKSLTRIDVTINQMTGIISIGDNAGIPVVIHPEHNMYIPCMIFGQLRSSSNYDDSEQREGGGRNGLGSKLTNIFSTYFLVETADGKNKYERTYEDNMQKRTDPKVSPSKNKGTKISFQPDYDRLKCTLDDDNYGMMVTRVYEIAACSPSIAVYLNGKRVDVANFKDFTEKFKDGGDALYAENAHWRIGVLSSKSEGFKHVSFCNATHTWLGGTHVEYLAEQLMEGVREYIEKKTKQKIKPAEIKNHFFLMVDCTVYNPRFSSQTKEHMNLAIKDYGTTFRFDEAFFKKLVKTDIVQDIIEWAINKKKIQDLADLKNLGKNDKAKNALKLIEKYEPAAQKDNRHECILFICEGDSAMNPLLSARDPRKHGIYPLRGKPLNWATATVDQFKKNKETQDLIAILGLEFGKAATDLRYGKIVISTDADMDGQHIKALVLNNFNAKWPEVLDDEMVYWLRTPIVRVTVGKQKFEFFTEQEYNDWFSQNSNKKMSIKFLKGLGGHSTEDFKKYMFDDQYIVPFEYDSDASKMLGIAFGKPEEKKVWLDCE